MNYVRPVLSPRHYALLTIAFGLFVIYGSLVPLRVQAVEIDEARTRFAAAMLRPTSLHSRSDWIANVLLFIPLAFFAAGALAVDRRRTRILLAVIPALTALSAALEFAQVWFPDRYVSLDDVVAETVGGGAGVATWIVVGQRATDRLRAGWARLGPDTRAAKALTLYLLLLVIVHGMPFDLTLSPWQISRKYKRGQDPNAGAPRVAVVPNADEVGHKSLLNALYFVPLGVLLSRLPGRGWRSARVFAAGTAIALAIEMMQLFVISSPTYASDVPSGGLFVLGGWWVGMRWSRDRAVPEPEEHLQQSPSAREARALPTRSSLSRGDGR